jgi:hypothetical protein
MNFKDITGKLKDSVLSQKDKNEDIEPLEKEEEVIDEAENMENEQKPLSDEVEQYEEQPLRIKTILVKSEDEEKKAQDKKKLIGAAKVAAGVGLVAAAGLAAFLLGSRKRK